MTSVSEFKSEALAGATKELLAPPAEPALNTRTADPCGTASGQLAQIELEEGGADLYLRGTLAREHTSQVCYALQEAARKNATVVVNATALEAAATPVLQTLLAFCTQAVGQSVGIRIVGHNALKHAWIRDGWIELANRCELG